MPPFLSLSLSRVNQSILFLYAQDMGISLSYLGDNGTENLFFGGARDDFVFVHCR